MILLALEQKTLACAQKTWRSNSEEPQHLKGLVQCPLSCESLAEFLREGWLLAEGTRCLFCLAALSLGISDRPRAPSFFSSLSCCELGAHAWEDIAADKGSCVCHVGKFIIILGLVGLSITDC